MALSKELDGDVTKIAGHRLMVAKNKKTGAFIGFYAFTPDAEYVRGAGNWIEAKGSVLAKINGAQLTEMNKSFISIYDKLDSKGETPDDARIKASAKSK